MTEKQTCIYADFFGLTEDPFGITPDPDFFYFSQSHTTALEWISYAIEQHEFGLVIGEVGSGKTVLSRCIVDRLPEDEYRICWIINPQLNAISMLKEIYRQLFQEEPKFFKRDVLNQLQQGLAGLMEENVFPLVVIDEAQMIPRKQVFDELRLLSNFQTDKSNLLSIILLGQPELKRRFSHPAYRSLLQRIRFTVHLKPLDPEETLNYLNYRMSRAGYKGPAVFDSDAARLIHDIADGCPRPVNHLAAFSMMEAVARNRKSISREMIESARKSIIYL